MNSNTSMQKKNRGTKMTQQVQQVQKRANNVHQKIQSNSTKGAH